MSNNYDAWELCNISQEEYESNIQELEALEGEWKAKEAEYLESVKKIQDFIL